MNKIKAIKDELSFKNFITSLKIRKAIKKLLEKDEHFREIKKLNKKPSIQINMLYGGFFIWIELLRSLIGHREKEKDLFEDNTDDSLRTILTDLSLEQTYISSASHQDEVNLGVNALDIYFSDQNDKFIWGADFIRFINSHEIFVTKWHDPYKQILICLFLAKIFNCYFDLEHHLKILKTFCDSKDSVLTKQKISLTKLSKKQRGFFIDNLPKRFKPREKDLEKNLIFRVTKYSHIANFLRKLPEGNANLISKAFDAVNPKAKSSLRSKFKTNTSFTDKIILLNYFPQQAPAHILQKFNDMYQRYSDKKHLLSIELENFHYLDFIKVINGYDSIKKNFYSTRNLKKILKPGIFPELLELTQSQGKKIGPIIEKFYKPVPPEKIIVAEDHFFNGYEVRQVKSVQELKKAGGYFQNCLRSHEHYSQELITKNNHIYFFTFIKSADAPEKFELEHPNAYANNFESFVCKISIEEKHLLVLEIHRKQNEAVTPDETMVLSSFLMLHDLIRIPDDYFASLLIAKMNQITSRDFSYGMETIIKEAPLIFALIKKLRRSKLWMFRQENVQIPENIESKVLKELEEITGATNLSIANNEEVTKNATT